MIVQIETARLKRREKLHQKNTAGNHEHEAINELAAIPLSKQSPEQRRRLIDLIALNHARKESVRFGRCL